MKTKHWINFQVIEPPEPQLREDHAMRPQNEGYKRKKINPNEARRQQLIEKIMSALEKPDDDEFDHIGKVIACKLRKWSKTSSSMPINWLTTSYIQASKSSCHLILFWTTMYILIHTPDHPQLDISETLTSMHHFKPITIFLPTTLLIPPELSLIHI